MLFLKRHLSVRYEFDGSPQRKEIPELPHKALRKAVINAMIHRDYAMQGATTMVSVLDDRVEILLEALDHAMGRTELQSRLELQSQANFRDRYLMPALDAGLIERTIPDKPTSRLQKYRLTPKGRQIVQTTAAKRR